MKPNFDFVKAIAILLVVLGHAPAMPDWFVVLVFSFHVPIFYFLSGLFLSPERQRSDVLVYVWREFRRLIIPYFFFFVVSYLFWLLAKRVGGGAASTAVYSAMDPLVDFPWGYGDKLYVNVVLWFFPSLFVTSIFYRFFLMFFSPRFLAVPMALIGVTYAALYPDGAARLPWGIDLVPVSICYFALGCCLRDFFPSLEIRLGRRFLVVSIVFCLPIFLAAVWLLGRVDLNNMVFGRFPVLMVPVAVMGVYFLVALSTFVRERYVYSWLSRSTLFVFPLHTLIFPFITGFCVLLLGFPKDFKDGSALFGVAYSLIAVAVCFPVRLFFIRLFPFVFSDR